MERVRIEWPERAWRHEHGLGVRLGDMNYAHHLGHDALLGLLQEARGAALATLEVHERDIGGYPGVVADLMVQYQSEARWPDRLIIETAIPEPEGKALAVFQRASQAETGRVVATARLTLLLVGPDAGVVALPSAFVARLTAMEGA